MIVHKLLFYFFYNNIKERKIDETKKIELNECEKNKNANDICTLL